MSIVVLRHSSYWCRELLDGDEQLVLVDLDDVDLPPETTARYHRVYRLPRWDDLQALAAVAGDLVTADEPVAMVYSPTEFTQFAAGYLRSVLRLDPDAPRAALATRDKRVMKQLAQAADLHATAWRTVRGDDLDRSLEDVARNLSFPVVAKPVDGFGTVDTEVLDSIDAVRHHAERMDLGGQGGPAMMVVEQFVEGPEFHADGVLDAGRALVLVISRYTVPPRELRAGGVPDLSITVHEDDEPELYASVRDALHRFSTVSGLSGGPFHLEFFRAGELTTWGPEGLVFSEIASRIGGGTIADLVGAHHGVNLRELTVAQGLGLDIAALDRAPSGYRNLGLLNLVPTRSGTIRSLPDREALAAEPDVVFASVPAQVGASFEVGVSTGGWTAIVVVGGDSPSAVRRRADRILADHPIEMES